MRVVNVSQAKSSQSRLVKAIELLRKRWPACRQSHACVRRLLTAGQLHIVWVQLHGLF